MGRIPRTWRVKTRLTPALTPRQAADLYSAFLLDVFDVVEAASVQLERRPARLFSCDLADDERIDGAVGLAPSGWLVVPQVGQTLGERIESAQHAANADALVVLGSDAPTMLLERIVDAFGLLERSGADAVVGPTRDGGYDLIGTPGPSPALLEAVPWSTSGVMEATRAAAEAAGLHIRELPVGRDIDTPDDLPGALADARRAGSFARRTARELKRLGVGSQIG